MDVTVRVAMEMIIRKLYPNLSKAKLTELLNFAMAKVEEWDGSNATEQPGCSTWSMEERIANKSDAENQRFSELVWDQVFAKYGKPTIYIDEKALNGWVRIQRSKK